MKKKKILVCGASGFIGRNIVERLAQRKDVSVYGTYFTTKPALEGVTLIKADLTNAAEVDQVIGDMDIVIQAAAVTSGSKDIVTKPYVHVTDNAIMNSLIFKSSFMHNVEHVVFFSCTVMYPSTNVPVKEEDFNYEITEKYFGVGWTKVYLEKMCEFFSKLGKTKYTAIRHSNIYGPYDKFDLEKSHFFGATITKVLNANVSKIKVWGDGSEKRDLLFVSDLVDFVEIVLKKQTIPFELVNVGFGQSYSVKDVVKNIIKISGKKVLLEFDASKPSISFSLTVDHAKARKKYNWRPKTPIENGIRHTIDWYRANML